jgi:inositol hexakisphosphate/diphosphoinositol-pentakisphosphate kinase
MIDVRPLYRTVKRVADFVMPQEYGVLRKEKLEISGPIVRPLLNRIISNLEQGLSDNPPHRVTLYFSSESHIHSLRNVLLLSGSNLDHHHHCLLLCLNNKLVCQHE